MRTKQMRIGCFCKMFPYTLNNHILGKGIKSCPVPDHTWRGLSTVCAESHS